MRKKDTSCLGVLDGPSLCWLKPCRMVSGRRRYVKAPLQQHCSGVHSAVYLARLGKGICRAGRLLECLARHRGTDSLVPPSALAWHADARVAPRRAAERFEERRGEEARSAPHGRMHPRCVPAAQTAHLRSGGEDGMGIFQRQAQIRGTDQRKMGDGGAVQAVAAHAAAAGVIWICRHSTQRTTTSVGGAERWNNI